MKRIGLLFALALALAIPVSAGDSKDEKKGDFSLLAPPAKVVWAVAKGSAKGSFWAAKKGAKGAAFTVKKVAHFLF